MDETLQVTQMDEPRTTAVDMMVDISPDALETIADQLYGTTADMWTVMWGAMWDVPPRELRALLRRRCNIAQDPVSGVWFQPLEPR